jgi:hypothetical protein
MTYLKVKFVGKKFKGGFVGMNYFAAKELKIPFPYKKETVVIWKRLPPKAIVHTIAHERAEFSLMKSGKKYHEAHNFLVNKFEKNLK